MFGAIASGLGGLAQGIGSAIGGGGGGGPAYPQRIDPASLAEWDPYMDALEEQRGRLGTNIDTLRGLESDIQGIQLPGYTNFEAMQEESRAIADEQAQRRAAMMAAMDAERAAAGGGGGTGADFARAMQQSQETLGGREQDLSRALQFSQMGRGERFQNIAQQIANAQAVQNIIGQVAGTGKDIVQTRYQPVALRSDRMETPTPYTRPAWQQALSGFGSGISAAGNIYGSIQDQRLIDQQLGMQQDFYRRLAGMPTSGDYAQMGGNVAGMTAF